MNCRNDGFVSPRGDSKPDPDLFGFYPALIIRGDFNG